VPQQTSCLFCKITRRELEATIVFEDDVSLAFLDHRPLLLGHCLLVPKEHVETLSDLPDALIAPFFRAAQRLSGAVESAMSAEGSFVAMNNRVSQSVPHLHVHVVPRKKGDGLKGFFWPRTKYQSEEQMEEIAGKIREKLGKLER
jgi:histidine triad (HIT) family protein